MKNHELNLTSGSIFKNIILYALPLMATNILQFLFNAADVAIVGLFSTDQAVAAVGTNGALIGLIINLFIGLSVGTNVLVARYMGAGDKEETHRLVGVSVIISLTLGVILAIIGFSFARVFLTLMKCDENIIDLATVYIKIYFLGLPVIMLYNFNSAVLRAVGDTVRPLVYLIIAGVVNIGLNVFFVVVIGKDVEGVAIATVASQGISAILSTIALLKSDGYAKLEIKHMRFYKREIIDIAKIGIPAGLQSCMFSLSNVLIQSTINSFGESAMTAQSIGNQIEEITNSAMNGISHAALANVSQNMGSGNYKRIKKSVYLSVIITSVIGIIFTVLIYVVKKPIINALTDSDLVKKYINIKLKYITTFYFLYGIQEVLSCSLRGLGKSTTSMVLTLIGTCVFRIIWIYTVCVSWVTLDAVYLSYPASYVFSLFLFIPTCVTMLKQTKKLLNKENELIDN